MRKPSANLDLQQEGRDDFDVIPMLRPGDSKLAGSVIDGVTRRPFSGLLDRLARCCYNSAVEQRLLSQLDCGRTAA
jgi:hypothetical protein